MATVELSGITKRFGQTEIVRALDLEVRDREFLVLVGGSGCGKSTTLRMVAGLETPDAGRLSIGGRDMADVEPKDRDVAMVFQSYALYPHMTVAQNVAFGLVNRRVPKAEIAMKVQRASEMLAISDLLERKPGSLSGGQRQRVALARALVRQPAVFLMDEPLSNLDAPLRAVMRTEIKRLHQLAPTTTIYVTHDQTEALTMGDRIAVMKDGRIEQLDTPARLYEAPATQFVARFIGSPGMNFLPAVVVERNHEALALALPDGRKLAVPLPADASRELVVGKSVTWGVRPEAFWLRHQVPAGAWVSPLTVTVDVVEPAGARTTLQARVGSLPVAVEIETRALPPLKPGAAIELFVNASATHLFDPVSERALAACTRAGSFLGV